MVEVAPLLSFEGADTEGCKTFDLVKCCALLNLILKQTPDHCKYNEQAQCSLSKDPDYFTSKSQRRRIMNHEGKGDLSIYPILVQAWVTLQILINLSCVESS